LGFGAAAYVPGEQLTSYRVDFENDPEATSPAQYVRVTDQLSTNLDWATFEVTEVGFGDEFIAVPRGMAHFETVVAMTQNDQDFEVHIRVGIDQATGLITAQFMSLDPDTGLPPDVLTGFLPPEDGTGRGQGHFTYIMGLKPGLPTGTEIRNVAVIQFDFGEIIATNQRDPHDPSQGTDPAKEALSTIDADGPVSAVDALPSLGTTTNILVTWSGSDVGSGVAAYDVYVSIDAGPWHIWLDGTTNTSGVYTGQYGHAYGFYSTATDNVDHEEAPPAQADTVTRVENLSNVNIGIDQLTQPGGMLLTYPTFSNLDHTVEYRNELSPTGAWRPMPGNPHNTGTLTDTNLPPQRYYRLRISDD